MDVHRRATSFVTDRFTKAAKHYAKAAALFKQVQDGESQALALNYAAVSLFDAGDFIASAAYARKQRRVPVGGTRL